MIQLVLRFCCSPLTPVIHLGRKSEDSNLKFTPKGKSSLTGSHIYINPYTVLLMLPDTVELSCDEMYRICFQEKYILKMQGPALLDACPYIRDKHNITWNCSVARERG